MISNWLGVSIFGFVFFSYKCISKFLNKDKYVVSKRMREAAGNRVKVTARDEELSLPIYQRTLRPVLKKVATSISKGLPEQKETMLEKKIINAGYPGGMTPREFLVLNYLFMGLTAGLFYLASCILSFNLIQMLALTFSGAFLGWSMPGYYLNRLINIRHEKVRKELPQVLDLLTVSVEAGLGFDGAIKKVTEKVPGLLAVELQKMLVEINMGKGRREALRDLADRLNVDDFSSFAGAVILADKLGISISNILRVQSSQIRQKQRQKAGERAMQAPVKMLFPMIFFIFPAIFVVLLGPAFIKLAGVFF